MTTNAQLITLEQADTLAAVLEARAKRTPRSVAYSQLDPATDQWRSYTWEQVTALGARWQQGLKSLGLERGDRVAVMLRNCLEWVLFDQAALGLGLVTVPVYTNDRADNVAYILENAGVRVLLIENQEQWNELESEAERLSGLTAVLTLEPVSSHAGTVNLLTVADWLPAGEEAAFEAMALDSNELATIVYTSGTTGRPKGVMLSHRNILWNVHASLSVIPVSGDDHMLSFLPLSHTFERTAGYYLSIVTGAQVSFAQSVAQLADDLVAVKPTILIAVPRIFERIYGRLKEKLAAEPAVARRLFELAVATGWHRFEYSQGRARWNPRLLLWPALEKLVAKKVQGRLGGRLQYAVSGGAALSPDIAELFIGLGINIIQGYGLTETSPVIAGNLPRNNIPASVGQPLPGVEVTVGADDELLTRSPSVMLGYWNNEEATRAVVDADGWLHTGDKVRIGEQGHIFITGRLKEIIVLSNGEKIPPGDLELAISLDPLIEQAMIIGERRPYLAALAVLNAEALEPIARDLGLDPVDPASFTDGRLEQVVLERIQRSLARFPGYAKLHRVALVPEPWSIENEMMTPTLKLKRHRILTRYQDRVDALYAGH